MKNGETTFEEITRRAKAGEVVEVHPEIAPDGSLRFECIFFRRKDGVSDATSAYLEREQVNDLRGLELEYVTIGRLEIPECRMRTRGAQVTWSVHVYDRAVYQATAKNKPLARAACQKWVQEIAEAAGTKIKRNEIQVKDCDDEGGSSPTAP